MINHTILQVGASFSLLVCAVTIPISLYHLYHEKTHPVHGAAWISHRALPLMSIIYAAGWTIPQLEWGNIYLFLIARWCINVFVLLLFCLSGKFIHQVLSGYYDIQRRKLPASVKSWFVFTALGFSISTIVLTSLITASHRVVYYFIWAIVGSCATLIYYVIWAYYSTKLLGIIDEQIVATEGLVNPEPLFAARRKLKTLLCICTPATLFLVIPGMASGVARVHQTLQPIGTTEYEPSALLFCIAEGMLCLMYVYWSRPILENKNSDKQSSSSRSKLSLKSESPISPSPTTTRPSMSPTTTRPSMREVSPRSSSTTFERSDRMHKAAVQGVYSGLTERQQFEIEKVIELETVTLAETYVL